MSDIEEKVNAFADQTDGVDPVEADAEPPYNPMYRMVSEQRIPISKKTGPLWKSRYDMAKGAIKADMNDERWEQAIRYYRNDQTDKKRNNDKDGEEGGSVTLATTGLETENVVFANVSSMIPMVYAKNPTIDTAAEDEEKYGEFARTLKHLINVLIGAKTAPGVNLKPLARRSVLLAFLTNVAWVEVGYTRKEESSESALEDLRKIGEKLEKAKEQKDIREAEGELVALEEKVDLLKPSGPYLKGYGPKHVLVDPDANDPYLSDAKYIIILEMMDTDYLKAVYAHKNDKDQYESIFKPTHVLKVEGNQGAQATQDEISSFTLLDKDNRRKPSDYGFDDEDAFNKSKRTLVAKVWDKSTRRLFLFNTADWKWPLWVWEDPYEYDDFFPVVPLVFYIDPETFYAKSEVLMYMDQQDGINAINNEIAKCREYLRGKVIYNKNVVKDERLIDEFLAGTGSKRALGVDIPRDTDIQKLFMPFMPQSAAALNTAIFDKERLYKAIDNVSSVSAIMRGQQYKTNTTNKAVESYQSRDQTRLDEKIDMVEDFIGSIAWKLAQLCVKEMSPETVGKLLGDKHAQVWAEKPSLADMQTYIDLNVVGGSTTKPTTSSKRQEALQIGQILGQYGKAVPAAIVVAIRLMSRAFDDQVITEGDWELIMQGVQSAMSAQQAQQGGQGQGQDQEGGEDQLGKVEQIIDQLPPPLKAKLGELIAKGAPIRQAVAAIVQAASSANGNTPRQGE